jgi:hypothetical protein
VEAFASVFWQFIDFHLPVWSGVLSNCYGTILQDRKAICWRLFQRFHNIENRSRGVRGKLALMAASAGLLNKDGEQYNNENDVWMKLD